MIRWIRSWIATISIMINRPLMKRIKEAEKELERGETVPWNYSEDEKDLICKLKLTVSEATIILDLKNGYSRYLKQIDGDWFDILVGYYKGSLEDVGSIIDWKISKEQPEYDERDIVYQIQ